MYADIHVNTGDYNRADLISKLFRETDRAQRMKAPLCLVAFCVVELEQLNCRLGAAACDEALRQIAERTTRLLRSYDILGRVDFDEFVFALSGCDIHNATSLIERLRSGLFAEPVLVARQRVPLSACFAVAPSNGRSPIVVLREVETALQSAREEGPWAIHSSFVSAEGDDEAAVVFPPASSDRIAPPQHQPKQR